MLSDAQSRHQAIGKHQVLVVGRLRGRANVIWVAQPVLHTEPLRKTCSPPHPGGARTSPGIVGIFEKQDRPLVELQHTSLKHQATHKPYISSP